MKEQYPNGHIPTKHFDYLPGEFRSWVKKAVDRNRNKQLEVEEYARFLLLLLSEDPDRRLKGMSIWQYSTLSH